MDKKELAQKIKSLLKELKTYKITPQELGVEWVVYTLIDDEMWTAWRFHRDRFVARVTEDGVELGFMWMNYEDLSVQHLDSIIKHLENYNQNK